MRDKDRQREKYITGAKLKKAQEGERAEKTANEERRKHEYYKKNQN